MREKLIKTIKEAAEEAGYNFYTGFEYRLETELKKTPALWLMPPTLVKTEGRYEGVQYYNIAIHLILNDKDRGKSEESFMRMEDDITTMILNVLSKDFVRTITDTKYSPGELTLTTRGETSMKISFSVQLHF